MISVQGKVPVDSNYLNFKFNCMKNFLLKGLMAFGAFFCMALTQAQTVSGTVSDPNGPLPGANIVVKGTTIGTQTDFDGNYTLDNVPADGILVFSYVGFITQEIPVNGQTVINVTLSEDATALDEVVVIGYGETTVKDATGAVASVTSEDFNKGVISSPEQLIQGKTAGVQITQTSGDPGAGVAIRIRGTNSVRSNNNPLFVVDGVPLSGDNTSGPQLDLGGGSNQARNPLNFLNPNDIESISILKDASATAIYGSRGANGVVIITTKSGKAGSGGVWEFGTSASHNKVAKTYDLLTREQYLQASEDNGFDLGVRDLGSNTDWQKFVFRETTSINNNLSYLNNYGSGSVRATFGYGKQLGVIEDTSLERITGRLNWSQRLMDDKLRLGLSGTVSRVNDESAPLGSAGNIGDVLGAAYSANPTWPDTAELPQEIIDAGYTTPANYLANSQILGNTNRYLVNFSAQYDILESLSAKLNLGYDTSDSRSSQMISRNIINLDRGTPGNGRGAVSDFTSENRLMEITVNYNTEFGNSNLDVLAGYSWQDFNSRGRVISAYGFEASDMYQMTDDMLSVASTLEDQISGRYQQYGYAPNTGGVFINRLFPEVITDTQAVPADLPIRSFIADTFDNTDELQSFFGRVNYTIADKYLFTATLRADGSSRFGEDERYGYFPSAAVAWKINEEGFMPEAVSTLKLRLNWGITGNQEGLGYGNYVRRTRYPGLGPDDDFAGIINDGGDINIPAAIPVAFANPGLKWESTTQYGAGLDFGFGLDRLNGSFDVYYKSTTDVLFRVESAQPAVQDFYFLNLPDSEIVNQGFELAVNYDIFQMEEFTWNLGFNMAFNENEITSLTGQYNAGTIYGQGLTNAFAQQIREGQPLFSYYLREFEGFDENGQPIQEDVQKFVGKSALPDWTGGISTAVSWRNWAFNAYFNGQFGNYIYNNTENAFFTAGSFGTARNVLESTLENGEAFNAAAEVSTRFLEKGDFVRLQSASLSYDVPLSGDGALSSLRLSLTGQNLFVITDYSGLDPEISTSANGQDLLNGLPVFGIDYTAFPRPRTFTLGLNARF